MTGRETKRRAAGRRVGLTLDSGALIAIERGDRVILTLLREALTVGASLALPSTMRSGLPTLAPIAAGTEKPMVPRPPELIQVYGWLNFQRCAVHIWCWPTPDATIVSSGVLSRSVSMTYCGFNGPSSICS